MYNSRLEHYLDEMERPLTRLSAETRREWREEARQHLLDLVAAHEELGASPQEAMEAALRQFGDARQIGRQLQRAAQEQTMGPGAALALFSPLLIAAILLLTGCAYAYVLSGSLLAYTVLQWAGVGAFLAVPILGGWRVGRRRSARRLGRPALAALALPTLLFLPIASVFLIPMIGSPWQGATPDCRWGLLWFPMAVASQMAASYRYRRLKSHA